MTSSPRTNHRIDTSPQLRMFTIQKSSPKQPSPAPVAVPESEIPAEAIEPGGSEGSRVEGGARFLDPDPRAICIGAQRLDDYLHSQGLVEPLRVREFLRSLDWSGFEKVYKGGIREPYAPVAMMGLVLYALMRGVSSLRGLEELARLDLGCQWVTGGLMPDHSSLGKFLVRHQELLTEAFFEELTRGVLKRTGGSARSVAGDGTVVQAAASRYRSLKGEAARAAAQAARRQAENAPEDEGLQKRAEVCEQAAELAEAREAQRRDKGRKSEGGVVSPSEPEAVIQGLKNHAIAPAYKGSVLANSQRIVVGQQVDPSHEVKVVKPMLRQAERIGKEKVHQGRFDAGYFGTEMITLAIEEDLDLLCPEGRTLDRENWEKQSSKLFPKNRFLYDPQTDRYRCPGKQLLAPVGQYKGNETNPAYVLYQTLACATCALKSQCTTGENGRGIRRYEGDEAKEALRFVMKQEGARRAYAHRQAWVEPVFSELTGVQGFKRFRRRGLPRVKMEFALHVCAHNLCRLMALCDPLGGHVVRMGLWLLLIASLMLAPFTTAEHLKVAHNALESTSGLSGGVRAVLEANRGRSPTGADFGPRANSAWVPRLLDQLRSRYRRVRRFLIPDSPDTGLCPIGV